MNLSKLGSRIRRQRETLGLKQLDVANALQLSSQAVSRWERGENAPDIAALVPLAKLFGVSTDWFSEIRRTCLPLLMPRPEAESWPVVGSLGQAWSFARSEVLGALAAHWLPTKENDGLTWAVLMEQSVLESLCDPPEVIRLCPHNFLDERIQDLFPAHAALVARVADVIASSAKERNASGLVDAWSLGKLVNVALSLHRLEGALGQNCRN